jgi:hypothetical protein
MNPCQIRSQPAVCDRAQWGGGGGDIFGIYIFDTVTFLKGTVPQKIFYSYRFMRDTRTPLNNVYDVHTIKGSNILFCIK